MTAPATPEPTTEPGTSDPDSDDDWFEIRRLALPDERECIVIDGGRRGTERVVPPAGEAFAFVKQRCARRVEIYRSAKGRSVRVYVDGTEVTP